MLNYKEINKAQKENKLNFILSRSALPSFGKFKSFKFSEILHFDPLYALELYNSWTGPVEQEIFVDMISLKKSGYFEGAPSSLLNIEKIKNEILLEDFSLKGDMITMNSEQFKRQEIEFQKELEKIIEHESND